MCNNSESEMVCNVSSDFVLVTKPQNEAANSRASDIDGSRKISFTKKQLMEYSGRFYSDELETHFTGSSFRYF